MNYILINLLTSVSINLLQIHSALCTWWNTCSPYNVDYVVQIQEAQLLLGDRATRKHAKDS